MFGHRTTQRYERTEGPVVSGLHRNVFHEARKALVTDTSGNGKPQATSRQSILVATGLD